VRENCAAARNGCGAGGGGSGGGCSNLK